MPYINDGDLELLKAIAAFYLDNEPVNDLPDQVHVEHLTDDDSNYEMTIDDAFQTAYDAVTTVRAVVEAIESDPVHIIVSLDRETIEEFLEFCLEGEVLGGLKDEDVEAIANEYGKMVDCISALGDCLQDATRSVLGDRLVDYD